MPTPIHRQCPCHNSRSGIWSEDEHDRFLAAIREFPRGPWFSIAQAVGTRSVRQVQTHTQKYYEKIMRRVRGLRKDRRTWARVEHRIDDDILQFCELMRTSSKTESESPSTPKSNRPRTKNAKSRCISPHNIPLRRCAAFAMDGARIKHELERCSPKMDIPDLSLSFEGVSALELPPFEEAIDFLIEVMETRLDRFVIHFRR